MTMTEKQKVKVLGEAVMDLYMRDFEEMVANIANSRSNNEREHCRAQLRGFCEFLGVKYPTVIDLAAVMNSKGVKVRQDESLIARVATFEGNEYLSSNGEDMTALAALLGATKRDTRQAVHALYDQKQYQEAFKNED